MKAKITVTVTREIDLDNDCYDPDSTYEERLRDEIQYADNLFHEWISVDDAQWNTDGELLPKAPDPTEST